MKNRIALNWLKIICFFFSLSLTLNVVYAQDLNPGNWPHLKGYWKFQNVNKLTKATTGKDLVLTGTHQSVNGPAVGDTAIRIGIGSYYTCSHGMAPNGGGDSVNRYTLMFDFKVLSFKKWHTFFKTDSSNNNDGECFIRPITGSNPGRIGVGATGYSTDSINPNQWYRLMISVNLNNYYRYYINGKLFHEGDTQEVDGRFALTPKMIFFGDDNQEDDTIDIASVAVFDTCMSAADIVKIGSIDPCTANPPKLYLGRDTTLCDYNSILKSAGSGYKKYQWSNGSSQSSVLFTKNIGLGKKNIWCKITDVNGCTTADTFILTYYAAPIVTLGIDQAFCEGSITKLVAGTDTSYKYLWRYLPKGNTLSVKNSLTTDSAGIYTVSVTSKQGCAVLDTIQITVYKRPSKPVISIFGKTLLCQGQSVLLSGPNNYFDYLWSNGANMQSVNVSKSDTMKLRVLDANNCMSFYSDSVVVKVFPLPVRPKIQVTGSATFCEGDSVTFNLPSGYVNYIWQDVSRIFSFRYVHKAGLYFASVTDKNGCKSPVSDSVQVTVNPLPSKPNIKLSGKSDLCMGETTILSGPSGYKSYRWGPGNHTTILDTVKTGGSYLLNVGDNNGCISPPSDAISITYHAAPLKPVIEIAGKDQLRSKTAAIKYKWFMNNSWMQQDTLSVISSVATGNYQLQIKDDWCWSDLSDVFYHTNSGIDFNTVKKESLLLYPNPSQSVLTIKMNGVSDSEILIVVYDMQGKEVLQLNGSSIQLENGLTIDVRYFSVGLYQVKILAGTKVLTAGFEKQ